MSDLVLLSVSQMRRIHDGVALLLPMLPPTWELLGGGYGSNWFRAALAGQGITPALGYAIERAG